VASTDADVVVVPASAGDSVSCTVDGVAADCSVPLSLTGLAEGDHNVTATAADAAGNTTEATLDWTVDTTGPTGTVSAPATLTAPFTVTFDEDASGVDTAAVVLTDEAGTTALARTLVCRTQASAVTDCTNSDVRTVDVKPTKLPVLGQYYRVQVNPVGSELVTDDLGNVGATVDDGVRAPVAASESNAGATYSWRTVSDRKAKGRSYVSEHRKGARASWVFSGKAVTWFTLTGPTQGKADVYVDGVRKTTVNKYAKSLKHGVARTVKGLAKGTNTIEIRALGKKGAKAGKGTFVAIDGFKVGKKVTATPTLTNVGWQKASGSGAVGGAYAIADLKGQTAKLCARGTSFTLTTAKGPAFGKVGVYVDGKLKKTADLFAKRLTWKTRVVVTGLTDVQHSVVIKVLGSKNRKSTGTGVVLDGVKVS
jgi:hypothetical protein